MRSGYTSTASELLDALKLCLPWIAKVAADHDDDLDATGLHARAMRLYTLTAAVIAKAESGPARCASQIAERTQR